jgi:hypothetical protein
LNNRTGVISGTTFRRGTIFESSFEDPSLWATVDELNETVKNSGATRDTSFSANGSASLRISNGKYLYKPNNKHMIIGGDDFTWGCRFAMNSLPVNDSAIFMSYVNPAATGGDRCIFYYDTRSVVGGSNLVWSYAGSLSTQWGMPAPVSSSSTPNHFTPTLRTWYTVAIERYGNQANMYMGGNLIWQGPATNSMPTIPNGVLTAGWAGGSSSMDGWIDSVFFDNVARYKGQSYTVAPEAPISGAKPYSFTVRVYQPDMTYSDRAFTITA